MNPYQKLLIDRGWVDHTGQVRFPVDDESLQKMFRDFLGAELISSFDGCVMSAQDFVLSDEMKTKAAPGSVVYEEEKEFREALRSLSEEEKTAVCRLLYRVAERTMFSALVGFDQFPGGALSMQVDPSTCDGPKKQVQIHPGFLDLHDEFYGWLDDFSQINYEGEA